jgi:hypothetical protein
MENRKMIPTELEKRNNVLFNRLVPNQGQCDTLEGETLRAINRIIYRYYNDGDYWFDGYGVETAGPAESFLRQYGEPDLRECLEASNCTEDKEYEKCLATMLEKIVSHIESRTEFRKNYHDMLDCEPRYEYEECE